MGWPGKRGEPVGDTKTRLHPRQEAGRHEEPRWMGMDIR